mmetsp:Transcript_66305/g.194454  ORF Transcript_66305/g.194454 Transcript_66305/m.194454 type:complete len:218 (-) Transcript_66305:14-667(-)
MSSSAATSAAYADVCAFSTAPRRPLLFLLAVLIEFSRNWRSSSRASALPFHLSRSFLCFLHSSSRRSASFMNQSSSFSKDWIFASRRVLVSSSSAFSFSSLNSFCTVYMKFLYARKKAPSFALSFFSTLSSRSSASAWSLPWRARISPPFPAPARSSSLFCCRSSAFLLSAFRKARYCDFSPSTGTMVCSAAGTMAIAKATAAAGRPAGVRSREGLR